MNEERNEPSTFEENNSVYEADDRRNKLAPKFIKHKVLKDNKIILLTNKRKVHKKRIKPKRKFTDT